MDSSPVLSIYENVHFYCSKNLGLFLKTALMEKAYIHFRFVVTFWLLLFFPIKYYTAHRVVSKLLHPNYVAIKCFKVI